MKECDILGGQNILWTTPTYFQGTSRIYTPVLSQFIVGQCLI